MSYLELSTSRIIGAIYVTGLIIVTTMLSLKYDDAPWLGVAGAIGLAFQGFRYYRHIGRDMAAITKESSGND